LNKDNNTDRYINSKKANENENGIINSDYFFAEAEFSKPQGYQVNDERPEIAEFGINTDGKNHETLRYYS